MACDSLAITLFRLKYVIFPQGIWGRDISECLTNMFANEPPEAIVIKTKDKLKKFLSYDETKIKESLFHPIFFMPIKLRAEIPKIQERLGNPYKTVNNALSSKAYQYATLFGIYELYSLMDTYTIPSEIQKGVESTLVKIASKDWKTSAETINKFLGKLLEIQLDENGNIVSGSLNFDDSQTSTPFKSIFSKISNVFK
jgi:hypothetical protein